MDIYIYVLIGIVGVFIILLMGWFIGLIIVTRKGNHDYAEKVAEFNQLKNDWSKVRNEADKMYNERIAEFDKQIAEKVHGIEELDAEIVAHKESLSEGAKRCKESNDVYTEGQEKIKNVSGEIDGLYKKKEDLVKDIEAVIAQVKEEGAQKQSLVNDVEGLKERKRLAILNQNGNEEELGDIDIGERDLKLIRVLKQIEIDYPEFSSEIATIEGRKIGLPQLQVLVGEKGLNGLRGIYRLVLKSDQDVSYVGQAVDIKTRGYEHVKKMIGVDMKGTEKLYKYRPEDFYWTVIEREPDNLDEAERYWIEYFGCKEKGLNKK